jgi:hypothetical protein
MTLRRHKGKLATGAVLLFFLAVVVLWPRPSPPSAIRLTFLYSTNHAEIGKVGVFQFVNQLTQTVSTSGGHYKPALRGGFNPEKGDWGATLGVQQFAPGTTNVLQLWVPTNGGPYKLVFQCLPTSKTTQNSFSIVQARIASLLSSLVHPSFATQARWYGSIFAESQSFETTP